MKLKTFFLILCALIAVTVSAALFTGCQNPERAALSGAKIEAKTVESAMRAFVVYEKQHGATAELRAKVDSLYQKVRAANLLAEKSWLAYKDAQDAKDPNASALDQVWQAALSIAQAAQCDLISFVNSL